MVDEICYGNQAGLARIARRRQVGLDPESSAFMQVLASKLIWARKELEKLAADHNLMLDGTLDSINDASFDHFGGPFFEGDDPIEIDPEIVSRLGEAGLDEI